MIVKLCMVFMQIIIANGMNNTSNSTSPTKSLLPNPNSISSISKRAAIVVGAICILVVTYLVVRALCSRRRRNRNRRYGMLKEEHNNMELRPLSEGENEDDDDDLTLFDASQRKR